MELRNGNETLRQVTDRDGEVAFENLRPGKWTMRVYQNNLPDHHAIETPETHMELEPGQSAEAVVRVLPKFRRVQLIDAGAIVP